MVHPFFSSRPLPVLVLLFFVLCAGVVSAESFTSQWGGVWTADCIQDQMSRTLQGSWTASVTETDGKLDGEFSADAQPGCSGVISGNLSGDRVAWDIEGIGCRGRGRGSLSGNNVSGDFGGGDIGVRGCTGTFEGACMTGCSPICPPGQVSCHRTCVDNLTDPFNCGRCNVSCSPLEVCQNGRCVSRLNCSVGFTACIDACVNLTSNSSNCGGCGILCPPRQVCQGGKCVSASTDSSNPDSMNCQEGFIPCSGMCVNANIDSSNCGWCGVNCSSGQVCQVGKCVSPSGSLNCSSGLVLCNATCVNTTSNLSNCGSCGMQCSSGQVCQIGACVSQTCQSGLIPCGGVCVNASDDSSNCGSCGVVCSPGQVCSGGQCVSSSGLPPGSLNCSSGLAACNGTCVNSSSSPSNCGGCGIQCLPEQSCVAGQCQYPPAQPAKICPLLFIIALILCIALNRK